MGQILESLKRHYANTPQEVLDKEWEELAYLNDIGPDVFEYAEEMKEYIEFVSSSASTVYCIQKTKPHILIRSFR